MPLSIKAVPAKVAAELVGDEEDGIEMVANHHHLPTVHDVLLYFAHLQHSSDPPNEEDMIR